MTLAGEHNKRPDIVLYINGIAVGVLELKRSGVSVSEGIRQNLDNQKKTFIRGFFSTIQLIMAGNDSEGLYYATIESKEQHYYKWKEENPAYDAKTDVIYKHLKVDDHPHLTETLDFDILNLCNKKRLLSIIHNFIVFDVGTKKLCRQNQYFGVKAAQKRLSNNEGGNYLAYPRIGQKLNHGVAG